MSSAAAVVCALLEHVVCLTMLHRLLVAGHSEMAWVSDCRSTDLRIHPHGRFVSMFLQLWRTNDAIERRGLLGHGDF